jgi:hypothetical protein
LAFKVAELAEDFDLPMMVADCDGIAKQKPALNRYEQVRWAGRL